MKLLVCGDRNWTDKYLIEEALEFMPTSISLIHGAARGADTIAAKLGASWGWELLAFPADWEQYGKGAGLMRNQQMLEAGPDLVVAFHDHLSSSRGTGDMVRRAEAAGVPVIVIPHRDEF